MTTMAKIKKLGEAFQQKASGAADEANDRGLKVKECKTAKGTQAASKTAGFPG